MKKQVLTVEQMKHLQSFGINIDCDASKMNWGEWNGKYELDYGITGHGICRAFTLQDILELMPCDIFGNYNFWLMKANAGYKFSIKNNPDSAKIGTHFHTTSLAAAYDILCWYYTKGKKEGGTDE